LYLPTSQHLPFTEVKKSSLGPSPSIVFKPSKTSMLFIIEPHELSIVFTGIFIFSIFLSISG
jgi:hypothetical protein